MTKPSKPQVPEFAETDEIKRKKKELHEPVSVTQCPKDTIRGEDVYDKKDELDEFIDVENVPNIDGIMWRPW